MSSTNADPAIAAVSDAPTTQPKPGLLAYLGQHPKGFWFIFWGEFAERCSYYGMRAILATYMATQLGLGKADAGTFMSFFIAACYFLPLVGGYIADNYFGKYKTIVAFSVPYILGHVVLGIENTTALVIALALLAMGSGVIKPNISTLMGMTYDQQRPGQELLRTQAFSIFYMAINIGAAISQFGIPIIKDNYGYFIAFLFPAALMVVAFLIFAAGKRFYATEVIEQRAKTPEEKAEQWRVVLMVGPVFLFVIFFWGIFDQSASTWIFFGDVYMTQSLLGLPVTAEQIQSLNPILIVILLPFVALLWTRLDQKGVKVRATTKLVIGFALTGACMGIMAMAGSQAGKLRTAVIPLDGIQAEGPARKHVEQVAPPAAIAASSVGMPFDLTSLPAVLSSSVTPHTGTEVYVQSDEKVGLWWQAVAYFLLTVAEILISVTGLELAFVVAPKSMKGFVTSLWLLTVFLANIVVNVPLSRVYPNMNPAMYFALLTGLMAVVTIAFVPVAAWFNRKAAEPTTA